MKKKFYYEWFVMDNLVLAKKKKNNVHTFENEVSNYINNKVFFENSIFAE